jgi:Flp pilus assembly pilin Flp
VHPSSDATERRPVRRRDESGQAMTEYILVVAIAVVGLILVSNALTRSVLAYFTMQALWISLPIM